MEIPNLGRSSRFLHTDQAAPFKTLAAKPLLRIRSPYQKTFGEAHAATVAADFASKTERLRGQRPTATEEKRKLGKLKAEIEESRQLATVGPGSADVLVGRCERIASHPANSNPPTKRSLRRPMRRSFRTRRMLPGDSQGLHPGLVCDAPTGHGVRNRVRAWGSKYDGRAWDREPAAKSGFLSVF